MLITSVSVSLIESCPLVESRHVILFVIHVVLLFHDFLKVYQKVCKIISHWHTQAFIQAVLLTYVF